MINIIIISLIVLLIISDILYFIFRQKKAKKEGIKTSCLGCDRYKGTGLSSCNHSCTAFTQEFIDSHTNKKE